MTEPSSPEREARLASWLYSWRWLLTAMLLAVVVVVFAAGVSRVGNFTTNLAELHDPSNGSGNAPPMMFDPSMDIWFGESDPAVETYYEIEDRFVAEDYVMVTFEETDDPLGVFGRRSIETVARLTERFLTVGGVRHVRSLTSNPWIRWGEIRDGDVVEEGLLISDLIVGDVSELSDDDLVVRMIAVLGAERAAARIGEERVRAVLGPDADFANHIGEPRLVGTIVSEDGGTTAIQVQVLRPRLSEEQLQASFGDDESARTSGPTLHSVMVQRSSVRGLEHFLRVEGGLSVQTDGFAKMLSDADALPEGEEKHARRLELLNPTRSMIRQGDAEPVRKWFEYSPVAGGGFEDRSDPMNVVAAPDDFTPQAVSPYVFRLGGVPFFERNFEEVGLGDAKYVPLMFLVLILGLGIVFRRFVGIAAPLGVVFGSILAMVGLTLANGNLLNNLTMMSPNMLTAVGIADAIHLVAAWTYLRREYDDKRELMIEVIRRNVLPVSLTSLTTAIGFYSLTVSGLEPVQMLGSMAGLGTLFAYLLSMTLVPAILSLVPHHKAQPAKANKSGFFSKDRSDRLVRAVVSRRKSILVASGVVFFVAAYGLSQIDIDSDFRRMFPDDNKTMSDFHWIEERMGGVGDLEIVFTGLEDSTASAFSPADSEQLEALRTRQLGVKLHPAEFQALDAAESTELEELTAREDRWSAGRIGVSTAFLTALDGFEARLREEMADPNNPVSAVSDLLSPLDILRKMHQVQNKNDAAFYRVPVEDDVPADARPPRLSYDEFTEEWSYTPPQASSQLMAQYYLQYENGARPGENLSTQLSASRTHFRMQGRVRQASSAIHRAAFERIEEIAKTEFPILGASLGQPAGGEAVAAVTVSGKSVLFARTTHLFATGFVKSMLLALGLITIVIGLIFRSFKLALVSLIPNVLPIIVPISFFGLFDVSLDGPAILVSSVALGVCVDDTVHLFTKFVRARAAGATAEEALSAAVHRVGGALTLTTVLLVLGFGTLLLSDFAPNFQMGALATVMIGLAWIADFVLTTATLSFWKPIAPVSAPTQPQAA